MATIPLFKTPVFFSEILLNTAVVCLFVKSGQWYKFPTWRNKLWVFSPFFFLTYDMYCLNVPVRTCWNTLLLICLPPDHKNNHILCIHFKTITPCELLLSVGWEKGDHKGVSAYTKGHYVTITMELHGQIVVKSVLQLQKEGRLWPWLWKENARSTVLEVFNPTATTLGISIPYHL